MAETVGSVSRYLVPKSTVDESASQLRELSKGGAESVILWIGRKTVRREARVEEILVPEQASSMLHFVVPLEERLRIIRSLASRGQLLLAQLHTHPGDAFHSPVDDALALPRHTGGISIVIPEFGRSWTGDLLETSVNMHVGKGVWTELSAVDVARLIRIESDW